MIVMAVGYKDVYFPGIPQILRGYGSLPKPSGPRFGLVGIIIEDQQVTPILKGKSTVVQVIYPCQIKMCIRDSPYALPVYTMFDG